MKVYRSLVLLPVLCRLYRLQCGLVRVVRSTMVYGVGSLYLQVVISHCSAIESYRTKNGLSDAKCTTNSSRLQASDSSKGSSLVYGVSRSIFCREANRNGLSTGNVYRLPTRFRVLFVPSAATYCCRGVLFLGTLRLVGSPK